MEEEFVPIFTKTQEAIDHQQRKILQEEKQVHPRSIESKLVTGGRLSVPPVIAIRDYTMEDATRVEMMQSDNQLKIILQVLDSIIQTPNVQARDLHSAEAVQLLFTVMFNFWQNTIEHYPYAPPAEELNALQEKDPSRYARVLSGEEKLFCDVFLKREDGSANVEFNLLPLEFKEPINIKDAQGTTFSFRLPRLGDAQDALDWVLSQSAAEELWLSEQHQMAKKLDELTNRLFTLDPAEPVAILTQKQADILRKRLDPRWETKAEESARRRINLALRYQQASLIVKEDGRTLTSQEEKLDAYDRVPLSVWRRYEQAVPEFGISSKVQVVSPLMGGLVDQEIQFQLLDLVQAPTVARQRQLEVSFG